MENIQYPDNVIVYGIEIRPYLTTAECEAIANEIVKEDNFFTRQAVYDANVLKYCVVNQADIEGKDYEMMRSCGFINELHRIIDTYEVEEAVNYIESQRRAVNGLINNLTRFVISLTDKIPSKEQVNNFLTAIQKKADEK